MKIVNYLKNFINKLKNKKQNQLLLDSPKNRYTNLINSYEIENISPINYDIVILLRNKKEKGKIKDFYEFESDLKELFLFDYILCIYQIKITILIIHIIT